MNLDNYRKQIDVIDDKIADLFIDRMAISKDIAIAKKDNNLAIVNFQREKEIINRVASKMPAGLKIYSKQLFSSIFDISKAYQTTFVDELSVTRSAIEKLTATSLPAFPIEANVACQGVLGSYSSLAAEKLFEISNIMYFRDFEGVFSAVDNGLCQYGVLPLENSSVGSVNRVYDLMAKFNFRIVRSCKLRIQHSLLANPGTKISDIKEIFSHEQALEQSAEFLKQYKNVKITACANTALAAKMVMESGRKDVACISSSECAKIYNLKELVRNIQDNENNYTRFIVISKKLEIFKKSDMISIMVNLPHTAGSLNRLLNEFSIRGLNLTKLMSRPQAKSPFEFTFYFDFEADINDKEVVNLIGIIENQVEQFTFLGCYEEI